MKNITMKDEPRNEVCGARLTASEKEMLQYIAEKNGVSSSSILRDAFLFFVAEGIEIKEMNNNGKR